VGGSQQSRTVGQKAESLLQKLGATARLAIKQAYRQRLKRVDLPKANLQLGRKAYSLRVPQEQTDAFLRVDRQNEIIASLRRSDDKPAATFGRKVKAWMSAVFRAAQIAIHKIKRRGLLKKIGASVRENPAVVRDLTAETMSAKAVVGKIRDVDESIQELAALTYFWARRPLLLSVLLLVIAFAGWASVKRMQQTRSAPSKNSLSSDQLERILKEGETFAQQTQRRQEEANRKETEAMQERIAAAERAYKEQSDRERAEREKKALEQKEKEQKEEQAREAAERARRAEEQRVAEKTRVERQQAAKVEERKKQIAEAQQARLEQEKSAQQQKEAAAKLALQKKSLSEETSLDSLLKMQKLTLIALPEPSTNKEPFTEVKDTFGAQKAEFDSAIERARQHFWQTYPDGAGAAEARAEFSHMLWEKDIWFLYLRWASGRETGWEQLLNVMGGGSVDRGIPPPARTAFDNWTKAFRKAFVANKWETDSDFFSIPQRVKSALAASQRQYDIYTTYRDWAEFDRVHREPAGFDDPRLYGVMLFMRFQKRPWLDAAKTYVAMEQALGKDVVRDALKKVHEAPKDQYGNLAQADSVGVTLVRPETSTDAQGHAVEDLKTPAPEGAILVDHLEPLHVAVTLMTHGDARCYLLGLICTQPYLSQRYNWNSAMTTYQQWVNAFGERAVLNAAEKVRTAIKRFFDGYVLDQKALGSIRRNPYTAFQDLLFLNDTKGYVRAILAFHLGDTDTSIRNLDTAYKQLVAKYTEDAVLAAARRMTEDSKKGSFPSFQYEDLIKQLGGIPEASPVKLETKTTPTSTLAPAPVLTTLCSFDSESGFYPTASLVQGDDGNFYGTTRQGPGDKQGTVFKITPGGELTNIFYFNGLNGAAPESGLIKGKDGNFYGMTSSGGQRAKGKQDSTGHGTIFKITPAGRLTVLHSFAGAPDGFCPMGQLVEGSDGNFYGTTRQGGEDKQCPYNGCGTVFRMTPKGELTILHRFKDQNDGKFPQGGLVQGKDGNFYGTTSEGGTPPGRSVGWGTLFKITPAGEFTLLHTFPAGEDDGETPCNGLVEGSDGAFYGTTKGGGQRAQFGTIFKLTQDGTVTILYKFTIPGQCYGPVGPLIQARNGSFYGTTYTTRSIFRFTLPDMMTPLYRSQNKSLGERAAPRRIKERIEWAKEEKAEGRDHPEVTDGTVFETALCEGSDGFLYGTSEQGGISDLGTVFRVNPNATAQPRAR
jgi:uncharacterized repeat protein (TIGR03803 family)